MITKAQVKHIRSLEDKKYRTLAGVYVSEGDKMVREALESGAGVEEVFAVEEWLKSHQAVIPAGVAATAVSVSELERISFQRTPNQALVLMKLPVPAENPRFEFALLLDSVQDPGNLGSIIRIADWFGISQVFLHGSCADPFGPKALQASMGSILRVQVTTVHGKEFLEQHASLPRIAATLEGQKLEHFGKSHRGILVIGNESRGVSAELLAFCDVQLSISGSGKAESLNAAVATGILCHTLLC